MAGPIRTTRNDNLLTAQSLAASFNSAGVPIQDSEGYALQANWYSGASPIGSMKLQASNAKIDNASTNWVDISGTATAITGNSGSIIFNIVDHNYYMFRAVYTATSGTGSIDLVLNARSRVS